MDARGRPYVVCRSPWVMVTLSSVGYGDVLPSSSTERFFTTVLIVFGTFLYAYIVGSFTNM
eukprot:SAG25_NODE_12340_length_282_cov_0.568306_1_plen_60_part_10